MGKDRAFSRIAVFAAYFLKLPKNCRDCKALFPIFCQANMAVGPTVIARKKSIANSGGRG
jgi:hypothetical protein